MRLPGLTMTPMPNQADTARFDLALFVREQEDGIVTKWTYKTDLFDRATINRLASQYRALLENIAAAPDTRLNDLTLQTEDEIRDRTLEETRHREATNVVARARPSSSQDALGEYRLLRAVHRRWQCMRAPWTQGRTRLTPVSASSPIIFPS